MGGVNHPSLGSRHGSQDRNGREGRPGEAARVHPPTTQGHSRHQAQGRHGAAVAGLVRRGRRGTRRRVDLPRAREGGQPPPRPEGLDPRALRRLERPLRPGRRHRRGDRHAGGSRAPRGVLPLHRRRAPRLGRVPSRDGRAGQVAHPDHHRALGARRDRRLPRQPRMSEVLLVTCAEWPQGEPDGHLVVEELAARGLSSSWAAWDDPAVDWADARLVAVRATWDYERRREQFLAWAREVEGRTRLVNTFRVLEWNTDKIYLLALQEAGLPVVPTLAADEE